MIGASGGASFMGLTRFPYNNLRKNKKKLRKKQGKTRKTKENPRKSQGKTRKTKENPRKIQDIISFS